MRRTGGIPLGVPLVLLLLGLWSCTPWSGRAGRGQVERLSVVFTSDTKGRIGDCGCSRNPLGGLDRRATLLDSLRRTLDHPVLLLDLGNLHGLARSAEAHADARLMVDCLEAMGYHLLLPGPIECSLADSLRELWDSADGPGPGHRADSLLDHGAFGFGAEDGSFRIRVGRWLDPSWRLNRVHALGEREFPGAPDTGDGLDLLAAFCDPDSLALRPERLKGWDLVLLGGSTEPMARPQVLACGTVLYATQDRGRSLGVVTLERRGPGPWVLVSAAGLDVHPGLAPDPGIQGMVEADRAHRASQRLVEQEHRRLALRSELGLAPETDTLRFVGAGACRTCHARQWEQWQGDIHSGVYTDLLRRPGRITPEAERRFVTGWLQPGGFLDRDSTPDRLHVQCEACHGPGQLHAASPETRMPVARPELSCNTCHSGPPVLPYHN